MMNEELIKNELKKHFKELFNKGVNPFNAAIETREKLYGIMLEAVSEIKKETNEEA